MSFTRSGGAPPPWYTAMPVIQVTSNYSAQVMDYYIGIQATGVTVTLPLGSSTFTGKTYVVKDELNYRFTVVATSPNLIDGSASVTTATAATALTLLWTGTAWSII